MVLLRSDPTPSSKQQQHGMRFSTAGIIPTELFRVRREKHMEYEISVAGTNIQWFESGPISDIVPHSLYILCSTRFTPEYSQIYMAVEDKLSVRGTEYGNQ